MSSDEMAGILEQRATAFLAAAKDSLTKGRFDVACVEAEQAAQLALKAALQRASGTVPRTHSVRTLVAALGEAMDLPKVAVQFIREQRASLLGLEGAYLSARYSAERFSQEDAKLCIATAETVLAWLARHLPRRKGHEQE
jgi:HEPN domain-containing protein